MAREKRSGFTLIELLVALVIFLVLIGIIFYIISKSLRSFSNTAASTKKQIEISINLDPLTFDIKHVGYGISVNETSLVLSYCNGTDNPLISPNNEACQAAQVLNTKYTVVDNKTLLLRETTNMMTSAPTVGFVIANNGTIIYSEPDSAKTYSCSSGNKCCVWLGNEKSLVNQTNTCSVPPNNDFILGFPVYYKSSCQDTSSPICCNNQTCTTVLYYMTPVSSSSSNYFTNCINGTYVFFRDTSYYKSSSNYLYGGSIYHVPLLYCVSDWNVWFGIDTNGDGQPDEWVNEIPYKGLTPDESVLNNTDIKNKLVVMKVYFLVQASYSRDPNYNYCLYANCTSGEDYVVAGYLPDGTPVELKTPLERTGNADWVHYHWRVVEITVNTFPDIP